MFTRTLHAGAQRAALLALSALSLHCGTSASSSGGDDASNGEGSASGGGSSSSSGGSVLDAAAGDGAGLPADAHDGLDALGDSGGSGDSPGPGSCLGSVTFRLVAAAGAAPYCENLPCVWPDLVTVSGSGGQPLMTSGQSNGCTLVDCLTCQGGACSGACPASTPLPDGGAEMSWDGTIWASGTCGANVACHRQGCAPAGQYTAHMCAYGGRADAGACSGVSVSSTPVCVDVPFGYPATGTVVGTLP